jgi:lipopolysaccharide/colanic/teichoic acid biosynthesis glycosyltransferase/ADP-glucose pyrophosphorylase
MEENENMDKRVPVAVVLANGSAVLDGVQIAPYSKCFLPVANRPLLLYQGAVLASAGVELMIVLVNSEAGHSAQELAKQIHGLPIEIQCYAQEDVRGTAGSLKQIEHLLQYERFLVVSGDLLLDADLSHFVRFHVSSRSTASVGVVNVEEPAWQMERVEIDPEALVKSIHRIHPAHSRRSKLRPVGLYLFDREVLGFIPDEGHFDIKEQLIAHLYHQARSTKIWQIESYCQNISSASKYLAVNWDFLLKRKTFSHLADWIPANGSNHSPLSSPAGDLMVPPVLSDPSATIDQGAVVIGPSCMGAHSCVGRNAIVNSSILLSGSKVGAGAHLTNCVLGEGAVIEEAAILRNVVILGAAFQGIKTEFLSEAKDSASVDHGHVNVPSVNRMTPSGRLVKRIFDTFFSACCLFVLSPIMAVIAILIKIDSPGEMIFRQRRCSEDGNEFTMYKFRSMVSNAEEVKREIQFLNEVDGPMFKLSEDPRTTRLGRMLRNTNLDELPQLWNILIGDMALVGPRPLSWDEMRFNPRWREIRLSVPQGLIGLWQVKSHAKTSFADWIYYDERYVNSWSLGLDLRILVMALANVAVGFCRPLWAWVRQVRNQDLQGT